MIYRSNTTKLNEQTSLDESSNLVLLEYKGHYPDTYAQMEYDITDKDRAGMIKSKDIAVDKKSFDLIINTMVSLFKDKFEKYNLKAVFLDIYSYYWYIDARGYLNDFDLEFTYFRETERFGIDADICDQNQTEFKKIQNKLYSVISKEYKKLPDDKKYNRAGIFLIRDGNDLKIDTFVLPRDDDNELNKYIKFFFYDTSGYRKKYNQGFGNKFMLAVDKASEKALIEQIEKRFQKYFNNKIKAFIIEVLVDNTEDGVYKFMTPFEILDYRKTLESGKLAFKADPQFTIMQDNLVALISDEYKKLPEDKRYNRARIIVSKKGNAIDADVTVRDPKIKFNWDDVDSRVKDDAEVSLRVEL